ncbi:MAG: hypothetical protein OEZ35_03480 [Candidatus Bathyarchaeota archaeon]|nr:hypothetical protein [Candidatus Bathyarchaeota archaeon]
MSHVIRIKRTAFPSEEKRNEKELRHMIKERINDLVKEGKLSKKTDKLMKQGKLKIKVPITTEIKVNDKAYKELLHIFKLYKISFKRARKGIEIDTTKRL